MSDEQKYLEILKEIGRMLKEKNDVIIMTGYINSDLEKKLKALEKEIEELRKEN